MLSHFSPLKKLGGFALNSQVAKRNFFSSQIQNHFNPKFKGNQKPKTSLITNSNNYLHPYARPKIPTFSKCNIKGHKHWNKICQELFNDHIKSGLKELMNNSPQSAAVEFESALELAANDQQRMQCYEQMVNLYRSETKLFCDRNVAINVLKLAKYFAHQNGNLPLQINATICLSDVYTLKGNNEKAIKTLESIPFRFQVKHGALENYKVFNKIENQAFYLLSFGNTPELIKEIIALNQLGMKWGQLGFEKRAVEILLQTFKCVLIIENSTDNMAIRRTSQQDEENYFLFERKDEISECLTDAKVEDLIIFRSQTTNLITDMIDIYLRNKIFETAPFFLKQLAERMQFQSVIYYLTKIFTSLKKHPKRQQVTQLYSEYEIPEFVCGLQEVVKTDLLGDVNLLQELTLRLFY
ncbi:tetratricopeptide repeat protein [Anaeramoeba flamelloides]|uniref:Tetratricopeptide repeat protein n=1 Tax=Anaeramoeba flamelloides TaxID=1746091 RepID=A0AAV7YPK3_9EUKA|nr:tetratricopeptide repeat protein [Anaeramoeba flamelloides]